MLESIHPSIVGYMIEYPREFNEYVTLVVFSCAYAPEMFLVISVDQRKVSDNYARCFPVHYVHWMIPLSIMLNEKCPPPGGG